MVKITHNERNKLAICNHIIASDTDIDAETYQKMRGMSYQEVLRTNGQISFPEVLRQQKRL